MLVAPLRTSLAAGLRAAPKSTFKRSFTSTPLRSSLLQRLPRVSNTATLTKTPFPKFPKNGSTRFFTTEPAISVRPPRTEAIKKIAFSTLAFGGTILAIDSLFNRETRASIPSFERQYLKDTFIYTGIGVGIIGLSAKALHNSGWSVRMMAMNPWLVLGVGLVGSIGMMMGTRMTDPDNYVQKHVLWTGFNLCQAAVLAPVFFYSPALIARAGLYTVGLVGSLSYVAATAKEDKYLYLGGPLLAGLAIVCLSSLAPMVLPLGTRALATTEAISLYGGLGVFGFMTLYDTQRLLHHARLAEQGMVKRDPINESIGIELNLINIFIRLLQILSNNQKKR